MRILYYIGAITGKGGVERLLSEKTDYFINQLGWEVHIMTEDQRGRKMPYLFHKNTKFHDIQASLYSPKFNIKGISYWLMVRKMRKLVEQKLTKISPDIVSVVDIGFSDFVIPHICKNIPKIREFHFAKEAAVNLSKEMPLLKRVHYLTYRALYYRQFKKYTSLILLTERDYKAFGSPANGYVIPNIAGNSQALPRIPHTTKKIITVGSMHDDRKGFSTLIEIWSQIKEKHSDWSLHIYGDGQYRSIYQEEINQKQLEKHVFLEGMTNEVESKMRESDFFVLTSKGEGFAMVLVEAQSQYLPVISYDTPCGPSDIVNNNEDGFIVKMNDTADLVKKICLLIENEDLRFKMGSRAHENSLRYSVENIMPVWVEHYNKLIQKKN
jgi:glycosyltransferase involved in cell wall biosynthesis